MALDGPSRGAVHTLLAGRNLLGRDPALEVPLLDERASRNHAEIVLEGGRYVLRDLGSSNGTYLNGVRCGSAPLCPGDELRVGSSSFLFADEHMETTLAWSQGPRSTKPVDSGSRCALSRAKNGHYVLSTTATRAASIARKWTRHECQCTCGIDLAPV